MLFLLASASVVRMDGQFHPDRASRRLPAKFLSSVPRPQTNLLALGTPSGYNFPLYLLPAERELKDHLREDAG